LVKCLGEFLGYWFKTGKSAADKMTAKLKNKGPT